MATASSPARRIRRAHTGWRQQLERALSQASRPDACVTRAPGVSKWSVGEHLEHLLLADRTILDGLDGVGERVDAGATAGEPDERGRPTVIGRLLLLTGWIPRGVGKAPDFAVPAGLTPPQIEAGLRELRGRIEALEPRLGTLGRVKATRPHPALGHFTAAHWLRFVHVHHLHHQKIIRDVLAEHGRAG